ncbi:hypothetical protein C8R43DRAFT_990857 [Mycena crocata]|nr:hypothetical protein C8R43DRAFT_990857 [Mycena crocata]
MRFSLALVSLSLLSSVSATYERRQISGFPQCANDCLNNPANLGGCQQTDETCLCKSLPFVQTTFSCITKACQGADQQAAISGAESLCLNFGVTLTAESSAIVAGTSTAVSGTSTTGNGGKTTGATSSTSPAPTTNSAQVLLKSFTFGAIVVTGALAALLL